MNTDWDKAIEFVLKMEGGETAEHDPNDSGGLTKFGISQKAYPNLDIAALSRDEAKEIYRRDYWNACKCDELPTSFAIGVFDSAVNQGVKVAARLLQISLNVDTDGVIGDKTIAAAHKASPRQIKIFLAQRQAAYARLMVSNPNLLKYAVNWSFRVISLAEIILKREE